MIRIKLDKSQRGELKKLRFQASSKDSEKALMVLLSADGKSAPEIAKIVKRIPHNVRDWLKRYKDKGISGLAIGFSPGRLDNKRELVKKDKGDNGSLSRKIRMHRYSLDCAAYCP